MKLGDPLVVILLLQITPIWSRDHNYFQHSEAVYKAQDRHDAQNTVYQLVPFEPEHYDGLAQNDEQNGIVQDELEERTLPLIPSLDLNKVTSWIGTENLVSFTITVMTTQLFIAIGWFVAGENH